MKTSSLFSALVAAISLTSSMSAADLSFYVGTYTRPEGSKGIYHYRLNDETGAVSGGTLAAESRNPSFLAIHPNGKFLYSANETGSGGGVSAFAIGQDGKLTLLGERSSRGGGACHVSVDGAGKFVFVANYGGGSIAAFPIQADGGLGEATAFVQHTGSSLNPQRQKEPHAHAIYPDAAGRFVYACDLGTDKVYGYRFDAVKGTLTPDEAATASLAPGSGPRHFAFHPKANFAYVINELLNTVTAFQRDIETGRLTTLETVPSLPADFRGNNSTAEIFVHPSGRFLYGSNRGHNSIAGYAVGADGKLTLIEHTPTQGKAPRNFGLDPSGRFLLAANQDTNNIVVFKVDAATGKLSPTGQAIEVGAPVSIQFVPVK